MTTESQATPTEQAQPELAGPGTQAPPAPRPYLFLPALATSLLLWLSYFPVAWGFLGWVALVPVLTLVRAPATRRRRFFAAWLCGLAFYWPVLQWMRLADPRMYATWAILATYGSLYVPAAIFLIRRLDRTGVPLVLSVPMVWTGLEFIRANLGGGLGWYVLGHAQHDIPGGYAWYFLGHTQQAYLPVIQIADLGGAFAVTFVVAAGNALLLSLCLQSPRVRHLVCLPAEPERLGWFAPVFTGMLLVAVVAYGLVRLNQQDDTPGPRVALLQTNIDQRIRNNAGGPTEEESDSARALIEVDNETLLKQATVGPEKPDLIIWPESSYPSEWVELSPSFPLEQLPSAWAKQLDDGIRAGTLPPGLKLRDYWKFDKNYLILSDCARWHTPMIVGLNTTVLMSRETTRRYNTALYLPVVPILPGMAVEVPTLRYDKIHRVPFGEYIPLRHSLPWLNKFAPYDYPYEVEPGERFTRFPLGKYHFGVLICFEDTDPNLARQYAVATPDGPVVDFLVNISNDGWFIGSAEHDEHLALCRFRAVECRRSVARSVNMGISAVIDGSGRVVSLPGANWAGSKAIAGVVLSQVPIDRRTSIYAQIGDAFSWVCIVLLAVVLAWSLWARRPGTQGAGSNT